MLPSGMPRELRRVIAAFAALAAVWTHPLLWRAANALPGDLGDPLLNTFILGWDADRMLHGFQGWWTAPFFFPRADTLALSEHLLGIAIFTSPIIWLTGNPVLAYNLAFFASCVLAGVGMYLLARTLWGRPDAAFLAALAFAFAPFRVMHVPHLQVLMSGWMPLSLWGLHGFFADGSRRRLAAFAASFLLLGLSNGYYLYFFSVPVVVVVAARAARLAVARRGAGLARAAGREAAGLALAAAGILAGLAPVAAGYIRLRNAHGFHRSIDEMAGYSARWGDALQIPHRLWAWAGTLRVGEGERMLFPGVTIVALAALAALSAWTPATRAADGRAGAADWRWAVAAYAAVLAAGICLAGGPSAPGPYAWMVRAIPGFDGLRVPARFAVIVALALAVLGGAGAAWLLSRLRPRAALAAAVLLGAAIAAEGYGGTLELVPFRHDRPSRTTLNAWLRAQPPGGVIELPIAGPALAPFTLEYAYNTLRHGHPIVNGYSGYGYGLQDFLGGPGSPLRDPDGVAGALLGLREIGVRYVLAHRSLYSDTPEYGWPAPEDFADAVEASRSAAGPARRFNDVIAWALAPPPLRTPVDEAAMARLPPSAFEGSASHQPERLQYAFDGSLATNWRTGRPQAGDEWVRLSFARETDVARLVVLTPAVGTGDYPRSVTIESETGDGSRIPLYTGSAVPCLVRGLAGSGAGSPCVLDLPSNGSRALWLRQTGRSATWQWAIHELQVFERRH